MSKKEEILHKLTTEDRNYIKEKFKEKDQQITELEEKLAEKDKELEVLKQRLKDTIHIYSDDFVEKDKKLKELYYKVSKADQDKISLAVEKLTEAKKSVLKLNREEYFKRFYELEDMEISRNDVVAILDNQINVLRNNKDGIH